MMNIPTYCYWIIHIDIALESNAIQTVLVVKCDKYKVMFPSLEIDISTKKKLTPNKLIRIYYAAKVQR